jgi:PilZ domain-containing protein
VRTRDVTFSAYSGGKSPLIREDLGQNKTWGASSRQSAARSTHARIVSNLIIMEDRTTKGASRNLDVRDRRYAIRFPFAADAELLDLESGARIEGVTSDLSMGGCFVCTSKPLPLKTRIRVTLKRKDQSVEALGIVRIVKPRIGMGIEFIDVESPHDTVLARWLDQLRRNR